MKISSLFKFLTPLTLVNGYATNNSNNSISSFQHDNVDRNLNTTHQESYNNTSHNSLDVNLILNAIEDNTNKYKEGINISKWQSKINSTQIYNDQIRFAIIRSSEGKTYQDEKFVEYWNALSSNGIRTAAYHNFRATCYILFTTRAGRKYSIPTAKSTF